VKITVMTTIDALFAAHGPFLRRRDLLRLGCSDASIRAALESAQLFRVRHGWYARPSTPEDAVLAVRVGGRLTGVSALASYGLKVPRRASVSIAVPANACRLRRPRDRRARLRRADGYRVRWRDGPRGDVLSWRVSVEDALLDVLGTESRDIAVACCDAVMRRKLITWRSLDGVFARAPARARRWRSLVSGASDAYGETYARLWCGDVGIAFVPQPYVAGVGRLDGRIAPHSYVEIDGGQHDESWVGADGSPSSFHSDRERDLRMRLRGDSVLRLSYRQLLGDWPRCLAAIDRMISDDALLTAARERHPYVPARRKRRRSVAKTP
jgi:hypothetical protein